MARRLHMALGGNTPIDHICERLAKTPLADEVDAHYTHLPTYICRKLLPGARLVAR
jgi:hypothetical protein